MPGDSEGLGFRERSQVRLLGHDFCGPFHPRAPQSSVSEAVP